MISGPLYYPFHSRNHWRSNRLSLTVLKKTRNERWFCGRIWSIFLPNSLISFLCFWIKGLHREEDAQMFISCKEGRKSENVRKNRYRNVVPFDHTRIKLKSAVENDYINANYINVISVKNRPYFKYFSISNLIVHFIIFRSHWMPKGIPNSASSKSDTFQLRAVWKRRLVLNFFFLKNLENFHEKILKYFFLTGQWLLVS